MWSKAQHKWSPVWGSELLAVIKIWDSHLEPFFQKSLHLTTSVLQEQTMTCTYKQLQCDENWFINQIYNQFIINLLMPLSVQVLCRNCENSRSVFECPVFNASQSSCHNLMTSCSSCWSQRATGPEIQTFISGCYCLACYHHVISLWKTMFVL